MRSIVWAALALALLLLGGCASQRAVPVIDNGQLLPPPSAASAEQAAEAEAAYRMGAHDLLKITVFGVPDLATQVRVNSNGKISLPLIGAVRAGGQTIPELEHAIAAKLAENYLQNPQVSVFIQEYASQRITLQGALQAPGIYPLKGKTTLLQAVAIAGGLAPLAETDSVVVFRQVQGEKMAAVFNLSRISTGAAPDPRVYGDDIIVVAKSGTKSTLSQVIKASPILALFFLL